MTDPSLKEFCNLYLLKNLIKKPTCFKNPDNPKVMDLLLTNRPESFCNSGTLEIGLSDFHKLTLTVLKTYFKKQAPKMINYRNYNNFSNELFHVDLIKELSNNSIQEDFFLFFYGNEHLHIKYKNNSHLAPWLLWVPGIHKKK